VARTMRSPSPEQHSSKRHQCCQLTRLTAITGGGTVTANAASYAAAVTEAESVGHGGKVFLAPN
jgi:hypothetical protein